MTGAALRGIGWDHPRCVGPLRAADAAWTRAGHPHIEWTFRSLADFNSAPLASLSGDFDLLIVDHPMIAASWQELQPVDAWLSSTNPDDSVGGSQASYEWAGATWASALDAAVHVSAGRPDVLALIGETWPTTWLQVFGLASRHEGLVLASLAGDDAFCTLLSVSASLGTPLSLDRPVSAEALHIVATLAGVVGRECLGYRPPQVLDMLKRGQAAFSPAVFSYATYLSAPGSKLKYDRVPSFTGGPRSGLLGGAGLAVSRHCKDPVTAGRFCAWVSTYDVQRDVLVAAGGQPSSRQIWLDPVSDAAVGGLFSQTLPAMDTAVTRPKHPSWPAFQHAAASILGHGLATRTRVRAMAQQLETARLEAVRSLSEHR